MTVSGVWYLYRLWAVDGRVMYVGITSQDPPERRIVQHAQRTWWTYVDSTRTELEVLNRGNPITKGEAELVERRAIQTGGGTLANNEWNGGRGAMFERFLSTGGTLDEWDPDDIGDRGSTGLGSPWSNTAGVTAVAAVVAVGLIASTVGLVAAIIEALT